MKTAVKFMLPENKIPSLEKILKGLQGLGPVSFRSGRPFCLVTFFSPLTGVFRWWPTNKDLELEDFDETTCGISTKPVWDLTTSRRVISLLEEEPTLGPALTWNINKLVFCTYVKKGNGFDGCLLLNQAIIDLVIISSSSRVFSSHFDPWSFKWGVKTHLTSLS